MDLDYAIKLYEEGGTPLCTELAEWLKELKRLKEAEVAEMWVARGMRGELNLFFS